MTTESLTLSDLDQRLYVEIDQLHGSAMRAKYRLTDDPDRHLLAIEIATMANLMQRVTEAYERAQPTPVDAAVAAHALLDEALTTKRLGGAA